MAARSLPHSRVTSHTPVFQTTFFEMPPDSSSIVNLLRIAAPDAIVRWADREKYFADKIASCPRVEEKFLRQWRAHWNLSQAIPSEPLAKRLNHIRPSLRKVEEDRLPEMVKELVQTLKDHGITTNTRKNRTRQTSLMSKFAFSLHPTIAVPYDRHARKGLEILYGYRIKEHDYPTYVAKFNEFAEECSKKLDETGLTETLQPLWKPFMDETLFSRRSADKLLMLLSRMPKEKLAFWSVDGQ